MDAGRLSRVFAANVFGSFLCAREAVRRMSTRHAARAARSSMCLRRRPARCTERIRGLRCCQGRHRYLHHRSGEGSRCRRHPGECGAAGVIHTEIHASGGEPNRVDRVKSAVPMQRGGEAEEVPGRSCGCCPTRLHTRRARCWMSPAAVGRRQRRRGHAAAAGRARGIARERGRALNSAPASSKRPSWRGGRRARSAAGDSSGGKPRRSARPPPPVRRGPKAIASATAR